MGQGAEGLVEARQLQNLEKSVHVTRPGISRELLNRLKAVIAGARGLSST